MSWTEKKNTLSVPSLIFTWEERDLYTLYGVPKGAVVLLALENFEPDSDNTVSARENGTADSVGDGLQEAEGGGSQVLTTFCQTDPNGIIEIYQGDLTNTRIYLLGYLIGVTYTAIAQIENPVDDGTWRVVGDPAYADRVLCVRLGNLDYDAELLTGVREVGSSLARYFNVMEREAAGQSFVGDILVQADESGDFEAYRQSGAGNSIEVRGYFSANVSFTEDMTDLVAAQHYPTWGDETVPTPADSLSQFIIHNAETGTENWGGVRENGSSLTRQFDIRETEGGGHSGYGDLVNVDGSQIIECQIEDSLYVNVWSVGYLTIGALGWPHKLLGVPNANISKIMGVPIVNIVSVMGVA